MRDGTATLGKLATLLAQPHPADTPPTSPPSGPPGAGWGMSFLQRAELRQALFKLADDRDAATPDIVKLLARKPDLDVRDEGGKTALLRAAGAENAVMVKVLVDHGADVQAADAKGATALHAAAASPEDARIWPMASALLAAGADVNAQDVLGRTPLFSAASKAAVDILLEAGADVEHRDREGNTALACAALAWKPHALCALLERGADPQATDSAGRSVIDMVRDHWGLGEDVALPRQPAALADYIAWRDTGLRQDLFHLAGDRDAAPADMVKLLAHKPELDLRDEGGKTALLRAAGAENAGMVKVLVEHAADVQAADARGVTALHLAAAAPQDARSRPMVSALLAAGADVHAQNAFGLTPLFAAASKATVELLLDAGADIEHRDRSGNTPLTYAAMTWRPHAMRALLERGADPEAANLEGRCFIDMVRNHYGLDDDAALPREPAALAGYIARREADLLLALFHLADHPDAEVPGMLELPSGESDLDTPGRDGKTVLMHAARAENVDMVKKLVDQGADVNAADANGLTALHLAAASPDDERALLMVGGLLLKRADVHAQNVYGKTPLFMATSKYAIGLLLRAGADIEHRDRFGNTALTAAATPPNWKPHVMLALLEGGADPQATNPDGYSFLDLVRGRYGLGEDAPLPLDPAVLADYIAQREVEPSRRMATAPRVPAPALLAAPRKPLNSLPSGHKISLVDRPHAQIGELDPKDLDALSQALGFGPLRPPAGGGAAQCASIFHTLDAFVRDVSNEFADYDHEVLEHPGLLSGLSKREREELKDAMDITHMAVAAPRDLRGRFIMPCQWKIMFGGSQNLRDLRHDVLSGFGQTSSVDRAARRIGELLAKQLRRSDNQIRIELIAGGSMGGASAQTMLATLQNRTVLDKQPSMLLLDPQLLNNRQAARATRDGPLAVDYRLPRGVAISLDYIKEPHRGLMGIMKGPGGYTYPGLVHLKLGLTDTDGHDGAAPKTSGLPGMGYHTDFRQYGLALSRFIGTAPRPEAGPPGPGPSLLDVGWLPPIEEFDPKVRFADAEPDAGPSRAAAQPAPTADTGEGSQSAAATPGAREKQEREARQKDVARLNGAVGRLQALAILDPQRARQAIENRALPAEVLPTDVGLDGISVDDVFDLYEMYKEVNDEAAQAREAGPGGHVLGLSERFGKAVHGIDAARESFLGEAERAAMWAQAGVDPGQPSSEPAPAPLNDGELALVKNALGGEGLALRRMNERAARAGSVVARMGLNAPKPLEGRRRADFAALVERDIARLAERTRIDRPFAADLLLRALDAGQMGARLRPDDRALLREVLAEAQTKA
jgi:ankyrin repeat protein